MTKSYGYGATRNLTPARENNARIDQGAIGNIHDAVLTLGAALLSRDSALHTALLANNATMFDGWQGFMAGLDDMNTQYGQGGSSTIAEQLYEAATPMQETALDGYSVSGMSNADVLALILALIAFRDAVQASWAKDATGSGGVNLTLYPSGAPFPVHTPHTATVKTAAGITADQAEIDMWFLDLATPAFGGIHIVAP